MSGISSIYGTILTVCMLSSSVLYLTSLSQPSGAGGEDAGGHRRDQDSHQSNRTSKQPSQCIGMKRIKVPVMNKVMCRGE